MLYFCLWEMSVLGKCPERANAQIESRLAVAWGCGGVGVGAEGVSTNVYLRGLFLGC